MIAVARNISYGAAYEKYITRKDLAVFVGAKNMVTNTDLIVANYQLDDLWQEFEEAGRDYVRRGKDVTNTVIAIEYSPTMNESATWTREQWMEHAQELLEEIDAIDHAKAKRDPKTKKWILDNDGKKKLFPVPHTKLCKSKWMAMLHKDSKSGIYHLHFTISRYTTDNELNCVTDIAHKAAVAAENINLRHGWTTAMSIRQQHLNEINEVINNIMAEMPGESFDPAIFKQKMEESTFTDYKGRNQHYSVRFHPDGKGGVDGYTIGRGKSIFTAYELGQKIKQVPKDYNAELKDAIYDILRKMNTPKFDWNIFIQMLQSKQYMNNSGELKNYEFKGRPDTKGGYYNYSIIRDGKVYNASQIGPKLTAKKIAKEYEKEQQKNTESTRRASAASHQTSHTATSNTNWIRHHDLNYPEANITNIMDFVRERYKEYGLYNLNTKWFGSENDLAINTFKVNLASAIEYLNAMNYEPNIDKRKDFLNRAYAHAMTAVEQNRRKRGNTMSEGQIEREYCITTAKKCLQNFVDSKMPVFSSDEENILGSGIIAKCIEDEKTPFINVNLEGAARELAAEITGDIEWTALRMTQLVGEMLLDIAIPQDLSFGGGGGGGGNNNDLPDKKDNEWDRAKHTFGMHLARSRMKR